MDELNSQIIQPGFVLVGWTFLINFQHYLTQKKAAKNRDVEYRYFKTYTFFANSDFYRDLDITEI